MLLRSAMAKNGFQPERPCERRIRYTHNTGSRIIAASATRSKTTVSGGNSFRNTPLKKNDAPHSTESSASKAKSRASIRLSLAVIASHICADRVRLYSKSWNYGHPIPAQAHHASVT